MKYKKFLTKIVMAAVVLPMAIISIGSCGDRLSTNGGRIRNSGPAIKLNVSQSRDYTKANGAEAAVATRVFGNDEDGFSITEYVSDINDILPMTKGTEMIQKQGGTGNNFNTDGRQFQILAFLDTLNAAKQTIHANEFNKTTQFNGSVWNWTDKAPFWRADVKYSMWSYWPIQSEVSTGSRSAISVPDWEEGDYTKLTFSHTVPKSLEDQQDLLFAYNEELREFELDANGNFPIDPITKEPIYNIIGGKDETFDVHFYHALAAIRLELADNGIADDVYIKQVSISGVYGEGDCTVSGNAGSPVTFDWNCDGNAKQTFTQTYNNDKISPAAVLTESSKSFRDKYSSKGGAGEMFMIPQTLSGVKMIVKFSKKGIVVTKEIVLDDVTWEAGKYYTYKLQATIHVPGEYLLTDVGFSIGNFKSPRTAYLLKEKTGSPLEALGIKKIGVVFSTHQFKDPSRKTTAALFYVSNADNSQNSKGTTVEYDFTPVPPSEVCPYVSNETTHISETYSGSLDVFNTTPVPMTYVFDIEGYQHFDFTLDVASSSNSAEWTGTISKVIVLEVEGIAKNPDGTYAYEYDYEEPVK